MEGIIKANLPEEISEEDRAKVGQAIQGMGPSAILTIIADAQAAKSYLEQGEREKAMKIINAIQTEGEAGAYIQHVTEAIHQAHADAAAQRAMPRRKRGITIAAAAQRPARKVPFRIFTGLNDDK